jgi:glucose/arabinose dehydrogenase
MLTLEDHGTNVTATNLIRIASGVRNPAGFAFHPATGDLYFQDNGIDGGGRGNWLFVMLRLESGDGV